MKNNLNDYINSFFQFKINMMKLILTCITKHFKPIDDPLGGAKFASKLNSKMNTPESCSFWVTDTGNISFSTQIHCFHQVLASWLSSISLLELKIFLLTTPPCHTSKVASWHVDCRYELHFWYYLSKILSKSWKTCEKLWFEQ